MTSSSPRPILALLIFFASGCSYANRPLNETDAPPSQHKTNHTRADYTPIDDNHDGYFVGLAISGGGLRSAIFAAACMFHLQELGLLQRVDYISAVSGGALPAAYYCVSDERTWSAEEIRKRLTHNYRTDVVVRVFLPWNSFWLSVSDWDRSDIFADRLDAVLFTRSKSIFNYGHLLANRPRLLINAMVHDDASPFVFDNATFDGINSDLACYPLARAVTASCATPVAFQPVTLRDFSARSRTYKHLVDGGIHDNLAILSLIDAYRKNQQLASKAGLPNPYPRGIVLIVIDAEGTFKGHSSTTSELEAAVSVLENSNMAITALISRCNASVRRRLVMEFCPDNCDVGTLRKHLEQLEVECRLDLIDSDRRPVHIVHICFPALASCPSAHDKDFVMRVGEIPTDFDISREHAAMLHQTADILMGDKFDAILKPLADKVAR